MSILLTPEVIVLFVIDFLLLIFNSIAALISYRIYKNFNLSETTSIQYNLEKQTYLASYIIKFSLYLKIILIVFFIYTIDKLSAVIPGAMCAVGVTTASGFGIYLLITKLFNIYLFGYWILINNKDLEYENFPYTKSKFKYFLLIYLFFSAELILQLLYFFDINPEEIVSCCSTVFNEGTSSLIGQIIIIPNFISVPLFYSLYIVLLFFTFKNNFKIIGVVNFIFLIFSLITLTSFFGTYIYELPTHHCPFCILQKDYNFIGYFIFIFLFLGTFFGSANFALKYFWDIKLNTFKTSIIFNTIYVCLVSFFPIKYYLINGVWL
ncbi:MAG: hypothetical protein IPK06_00880 [Ignavibacteriae bacterium]|nr:hypothetical protein [Ignavibacteriota bacterium]